MGDLVGIRPTNCIDGYCLLVDDMKKINADKFVDQVIVLMKLDFVYLRKLYMVNYDAMIFEFHCWDQVVEIGIDSYEWIDYGEYGEQVFAIVKIAEFKAAKRMALDSSM